MPPDDPKEPKKPDDTDLRKELESAKARADELQKKLDALKPSDDPPDDDLNKKVRDQNVEKARREEEAKNLEESLKFNLSSDKFLLEHKAILPKEIGDLFAAAEKEKYDSAIEKANVMKAAIIQSFFSLQSYLDMLTAGHKVELENFLKLTKKGREEKADSVYKNIFEPTLEMVKRVKKAEELAKANSGILSGSEADVAYKNKLMAQSRQHYLGEK